MGRKVSTLVSTMRLLHPEWKYKEDTRSNHHSDTYIDTRKNHHVSKFDAAIFVAIDGEGVNTGVELRDGDAILQEQKYVLLMNSLGEKVVNLQGLSTEVCLDFLLNSAKTKSATLVCYGASYDVNMMLRELPEEKLRKLHKDKKVFYKNYILFYTPRKVFTVVKFRREWNAEKKDHDIVVEKSVTLWDVIGFFQSSFVYTLKTYFLSKLADMSAREKYERIIPLIEQGKNERRVFTLDQLETFIEPYCKMEVDALVDLMKVLHGYISKAGLVLSRWDGSGAVATAMLKKYNVKMHIDESLFPREVIVAGEYAYFGGRIEVLLFGNYVYIVYHYDINSAYPSCMALIPSFIGGKWKHHTQGRSYQEVYDSPTVSLFLVEWECRKGTDPIVNPFPWRSKDNRVFFPKRGMNWIYKPELEMALNKFRGTHSFMVRESWEYTPATPTVYPYSFVPEMYELRKVAIKNGDGTQIVYKLALNTLYGKTAQNKGYNAEEERKPPYHNIIIAGLITSYTRAKLMEAAMQSPEDIVFLATDGIYSKVPLDLPGTDATEKIMGEWEYQTHDFLTIFMSGVYWTASNDPTKDDNAYSRGYDKKFKDADGNEVTFMELRPHLLKAWEDGKTTYAIPSTRFVTIGSAIALGKHGFKQHCWWRTINRELDLRMESVSKSIVYDKESNPAYGLVRAMPYYPYFDAKVNVMSKKYAFEWDIIVDGLSIAEYIEEAMVSKE